MSQHSPVARPRFALRESFRALRYRDFRLFWLGAFLSFTGSWIQMTGQQWLVYELTGSKHALGMITFMGAAPMFFLGPFGGWLADRANRRGVLVAAQVAFSLSAFILAASVYFDFVSYGLIAVLAVVNGCTSVIEFPTRQSIISNIVPEEDLASALPLSSATFNAARVIGPAIGGILLASFGAGACYLINGISFAAIIFAILAIRADLRSTGDTSAPLMEALFEGIRHVGRTPAFRLLVCMMMTTAVFGFFYIALLSAFAKSVLGVGQLGFGSLLSATGVGAIIGVVTLAGLSTRSVKGMTPLVAMLGVGTGLVALSFCTSIVPATIALGAIGMFAVGQMVGTNTALQYFSPPELRGRVIAVHIWSLAGLNPIGALIFGSFSERYGLPLAFRIGGAVVLSVGVMALCASRPLRALG